MAIGLDEAKRRLRLFADVEAAETSPLYAHLGGKAAEDDDVAGLLTSASSGDAQGTLLMATAHRLIQADPIHPLSRYYPSLGGFDGVDGETWPMFREFLLGRADKARELISSRYTQTNEVRRAALLYPALSLVSKEAGGKFSLLEVGCSAGLLLGLDKFSYRYQCDGGEQLSAGPAKTAVGLHAALDLAPGAVAPKLLKKLTIVARAGLDRAPVDADDEEELAWLEACVWADQPDRIRLLRTAAAAQRKYPPDLIAGDAIDDLATAAATLPADVPLVVMTSHVLAYFGDRRPDFIAELRKLAAERPLWWVSEERYEAGLEYVLPGRADLEATDGMGVLGVVRWADGEVDARALARTAAHGQRLTWLVSVPAG
ncbi:MAG: hypothetical protein JWQ81_2857 [Amycolatopsis sp.]|jgi:hypothetical protein|uniref:DUF2332 domain-containing protein n=1 Tax=Amycolatopsis sp. TaxID=37632 RepID=UPI00261A0860|nr:DUF2332 domain-containing protein [Amycolatopsis sp.]MCU1682118.1 hypothetical protein [Amycolatopsis sp.]